MGVIEEMASKLRGAERAMTRARHEWEASAAQTAELRKELERREARVMEVQKALSLLRNGMRTATTETTGGNVTQLKPR